MSWEQHLMCRLQQYDPSDFASFLYIYTSLYTPPASLSYILSLYILHYNTRLSIWFKSMSKVCIAWAYTFLSSLWILLRCCETYFLVEPYCICTSSRHWTKSKKLFHLHWLHNRLSQNHRPIFCFTSSQTSPYIHTTDYSVSETFSYSSEFYARPDQI